MQNYFLISFAVFCVLACQSRPTVIVNEGLSVNDRFQYSEPPNWNSSMQKMKQHLSNLEPYLFNSIEFKNPKNHKLISREIHNLAAISKDVKHDPAIESKDPTVRFVAEGFSQEIPEAGENFDKGLIEYARWQLKRTTKYCLECHARMNDGTFIRSAIANPPYVKTLPPEEQIELMIAFRQFQPAFDFALTTLKNFKDRNSDQFSVDRVARLGLLIAVQQIQDRNQALRFVDAIDKNMSLPEFLRETNRLWKKSIEKWDPNKGLENLSAMRELSKSRTSEVEAMRLIPTLLQHLNQFPGDGDTAETLYLLGENYEYSYKISMLEIPENYYELCIKQAPKTKWAKKCFERFKELTVLGYSGSGGTHIPKNVQHHLDKLKKLTE